MAKRGRPKKKHQGFQWNWKRTLCWSCEHSINGCTWARDGIPVEGWDATPSEYAKGSYRITFCPEYKAEGKRKYTNDAETWDKFCSAIVTHAIKDYAFSAQQLMENHESYAEAYEKLKDEEAFARYATGLHAKYHLRKNSRNFEPWWSDIATFVSASRRRHTKRMLPYQRLQREYIRHMQTIWECEKFLLSEDFTLYSDMDGARLLSDLNEMSGFDKDYAEIRGL